MKTRITKSQDWIIVSIDGRLDHESNEPLKENLSRLLSLGSGASALPQKIIFNFEMLEFVGSCGLSSFIQTLKDFNARSPVRPRYCNVGSEFRKIIRAFDEEAIFEFHDSEERARRSFDC